MTEMEKINQMTDDSVMDYVDEPDNAPKKEGRIKRLVKKAKENVVPVAKGIGKFAVGTAVTTGLSYGAMQLICHLTGQEIVMIPKATADQLEKIADEVADRLKAMEAAKDAVEETIDA